MPIRAAISPTSNPERANCRKVSSSTLVQLRRLPKLYLTSLDESPPFHAKSAARRTKASSVPKVEKKTESGSPAPRRTVTTLSEIISVSQVGPQFETDHAARESFLFVFVEIGKWLRPRFAGVRRVKSVHRSESRSPEVPAQAFVSGAVLAPIAIRCCFR